MTDETPPTIATAVTEPVPDPATTKTTTVTVTPPVDWRQDLYQRATSRKFIAYAVAILTTGQAYFSHALDANAAIASILTVTIAYIASEAYVDHAGARAG